MAKMAALLGITAAGLYGLLTGCGPTEQQQAGNTRRMAERLEAIADSADPATHPYVNSLRVGYYRGLVEQLRESGAAADPRGRVRLLDARFTLASELLRAGRSEEAAQEYRLLQDSADPRFRGTLRMLVGISCLRLGEQENCILRHDIDSCLLPIRGSGVHQDQRGSRAAVDEFLAVLEANPEDLTARWLLNLAFMTLGEYPHALPEHYLIPPEAFASDYDIGRFDDVAPVLGLDAVGLSGGGIMEDFDGDGHLDIIASSWGLRDQIRYFRNRGDGTFADLTAEAGLTGIVGGLNALQADYDNNGSADVLVLRGAWLDRDGQYPNSLLANLGGGSFADATEAAGLLTSHPTQTAAWGDFDNDGWVDLFVGNETVSAERHPCELFRNSGAGGSPVRFRDEAEAAGVSATIGARIRIRVRTMAGRRSIESIVSSGDCFGASPAAGDRSRPGGVDRVAGGLLAGQRREAGFPRSADGQDPVHPERGPAASGARLRACFPRFRKGAASS